MASEVGTPGPLPVPSPLGRFAFWLAHHLTSAQSPRRAIEEAFATCRGLYPYPACARAKESPL